MENVKKEWEREWAEGEILSVVCMLVCDTRVI